MNIHKNARLTPHGRERIVRLVRAGRRRRPPAKPQASARGRCANGWSGSSRGRRRPAGSLVAAASAAPADAAGGRRAGRSPAPPALHRQADRRRTRHLAGDRQPHPQAPGAQPHGALEPAEPVRRYEREKPGEMIHIDIKKLGRFDRVGHRITGDRRPEQLPRRRLGVRPRLHRRCLARRLRPDPADERRRAPSPSSRPPSPTTPASASPSRAS